MAKNINMLVDGEIGSSIQVPAGADWELNIQILDIDGARLDVSAAEIQFYDKANRNVAGGTVLKFTKTLTLSGLDGEAVLTTPDSDTDFVVGEKMYGFLKCTEAGGDISISPNYFILTVY